MSAGNSATDHPIPNVADPHPEVTWQVAFFSLVPLAVGCMTQPVGRVLDTPAELRFWMRANPLVCVSDVLYYFTRILMDVWVGPRRPWRYHFQTALADRFCDTDWSAPRPKFEQAAAGRWMLLLLGGIPCQTIKLMGMRGIPATQGAASMYAVALVFGEVLNVFAEISLRRNGLGDATPTVNLPDQPQHPSIRRKVLFNYILLVAQTLPSWWLTTNLLSAVEEATAPPAGMLWAPVFVWHPFAPLALWLVQVGFPSALDIAPFDIYSTDNLSRLVNTYTIYVLWIGLGTLLSLLYALNMKGDVGALGAIFLGLGIIFGLLVPICVFCWFGWVVLRLLARSKLGQVLGIPRDESGLQCFVSFLILLVLVVLSYAYTFDGTGTANPTWLGIFG